MKNGPYILVKAPPEYPGKKYREKYVYEHTLVWWQHTKIIPPEGYQIHHRNECRTDNRYENLEMVCKGTHQSMHVTKRNPAKKKLLICAECGIPYERLASYHKSAMKIGYKNSYCSAKCQFAVVARIKKEMLQKAA